MRRSIRETLSRLVYLLIPSSVTRIFLLIAVVMLVGGITVMIFEREANPGQFPDVWNSIWWALVTMTTVGYGDKTPVTWGGRLIAASIMFMGISLVSLLTATISSFFVARRIREDRGLEQIDLKGHIVICGWNDKAENLIDSILELSETTPQIVLINDLSEDQIQGILYRYDRKFLKYVRGDFTRESVLRRANIRNASTILLLPNLLTLDSQDADEKTVLATLSIRSLNKSARIIAYIMNRENKPHLLRARADEVIVSDEYTSYLMASYIFSPGVPYALSDLLKYATGHRFEEVEIPGEFVGKTFRELWEYFRKKEKQLLIGLSSRVHKIAIQDFLTANTSQIDAFIERKLREAGKALSREPEIEVNLNPEDTYIIKEGERAILIR